LEIMSPLLKHEIYADLLGRFVIVLTEELGLPIQAGGATTLRRRRKRRGLEPDRSWWIAHAKDMQGRLDLDLKRDPPPDLAVEIDVTHSSLDRMSIYAKLGVPEVWRFEGGRLEVYLLAGDGHYAQSAHSPTFPSIPVAELVRFVDLGVADSDTAMSRAFRAWVREQLDRPAE